VRAKESGGNIDEQRSVKRVEPNIVRRDGQCRSLKCWPPFPPELWAPSFGLTHPTPPPPQKSSACSIVCLWPSKTIYARPTFPSSGSPRVAQVAGWTIEIQAKHGPLGANSGVNSPPLGCQGMQPSVLAIPPTSCRFCLPQSDSSPTVLRLLVNQANMRSTRLHMAREGR
jgi:hypothetical protein